jgi:NAD(P)-dependent dehydrogenase (short-subunit alcohol dehydrogenase family)
MLLDGKVALVTGSSQGLGRTIACHLCKAGARGVAFDKSTSFEDLPQGWLSMSGDVGDENSLAKAISFADTKFGGLDIVVANAGLVPQWRETEHIDLDEWRQVFEVNVGGVIATIKHAVPLLKKQGGAIVVMGSLNSHRAHPRQCLYTATKHAVMGIVRSTAMDLGQYGIRVNAMGPGPIATDALVGRIRTRADQGGHSADEVIDQLARESALKRMATEEEVAKLAVFLASENASGLTGQLVPIDAGIL